MENLSMHGYMTIIPQKNGKRENIFGTFGGRMKKSRPDWDGVLRFLCFAVTSCV